jgi:ABC-type antimicrobial peptide transport system permease subunit
MAKSTTSSSSSSTFSTLFMQFLLISSCFLAVFAEIHGVPSNKDSAFETAYAIFPRHVRSPYDVMVLAEKREKPLSGYGWDQCEFSPMSCLLRRRRR